MLFKNRSGRYYTEIPGCILGSAGCSLLGVVHGSTATWQKNGRRMRLIFQVMISCNGLFVSSDNSVVVASSRVVPLQHINKEHTHHQQSSKHSRIAVAGTSVSLLLLLPMM